MQWAAARRAFLLAIVGLAAAHWAMLGFGLSWLSGLDGWFWPITDRPRWQPWLLAGLIAATLTLTASAIWGRSFPKVRVAGLVALAYLLQHGAAWSEGRGIHGLRGRIADTGHAEFVDIAVRERSTPEFLRTYQSRVEGGSLGRYARASRRDRSTSTWRRRSSRGRKRAPRLQRRAPRSCATSRPGGGRSSPRSPSCPSTHWASCSRGRRPIAERTRAMPPSRSPRRRCTQSYRRRR